MKLRVALRSSYKSKDLSEKDFKSSGFVLDRGLSNIESRVYYRQSDKKLLVVYRGTKNMHDVSTDVAEMFGMIKHTSRYKSSKDILNRAKAKYGVNATILGHSLGGSLASAVNSDRRDTIVTYNKGQGFGVNSTKSNEIALRHRGDIVSLLGSRKSKSTGYVTTPLRAHGFSDFDPDLDI